MQLGQNNSPLTVLKFLAWLDNQKKVDLKKNNKYKCAYYKITQNRSDSQTILCCEGLGTRLSG